MVCHSGRDEPLGRPPASWDLLSARVAELLRARATNADRVGTIPYGAPSSRLKEARKLVEVLEDAGAFMQSPAQFS
jgi:hypothetical protein